MSSLQQVSLPDAFWFQEGPGLRNWQFTTSGIKVLNVGNILPEGTIDLSRTDRYISEDEFFGKYSHFSVDAGDLVIASSGISFDADGFLRTKIAFVEAEHLPLCMNTSTIRFKAKAGKSNLNYLRHWFQSESFRQQVSRLVTGSAQLNFGPSHLKQMTLSLPPLDEQKRIAAILDQADALRRLRTRALDRLGALGQAIFHEMFGDVRANSLGFPLKAFGYFADIRLGKMLDKAKFKGGDLFPYLRNANVRWFGFDMSDVSEMEFSPADTKRFSVKAGDLMICEGGEPGRCAVWEDEEREVFYQKALHRARLDEQQALPDYIAQWFFAAAKVGAFEGSVTAATISHLTGEKIKALEIMLPPLTLQRTFASRLASLRAANANALSHLDHTESLFTSLQHRAFRGEL